MTADRVCLWLLPLLALAASAAPAQAREPAKGPDVYRLKAGTYRVVDGDSLAKGRRAFRLAGLDAPEWNQTCARPNGETWACGKAAKEALIAKTAGRALRCRRMDEDRYGRPVVRCALGAGSRAEDLNAWMVREGWAVAYTRYSDAYVREEAAAKAERKGIWGSSFQRPEAFRMAERRADCERLLARAVPAEPRLGEPLPGAAGTPPARDAPKVGDGPGFDAPSRPAAFPGGSPDASAPRAPITDFPIF